jgi:hypothetical protein
MNGPSAYWYDNVFLAPPDDDERTDEEIAADEEARIEGEIDRAEQRALDREEDSRW